MRDGEGGSLSEELLVTATRGDAVETVHMVSAVLVDEKTRLVGWAGDRDYRTYMRSAAKPFQAWPLIAEGAAEALDVSDEELALCCASHNSELWQVDLVARFLDRIGCGESDLACGPHRALYYTMAVRSGTGPEPEIASPGALASNCSGKHAGMLALATHLGWRLEGYHEAGHELQHMLKRVISDWCGIPEGEIGVAVDGCGVATFHLSLAGMARAYAGLAAGRDEAARVIVRAMMEHPDLVAGAGRLSTELMQLFPGKLVAKVGASGIYCGAVLDPPLGIALKAHDGNNHAAGAAFLAVLDRLGFDPPPSSALVHHGRRAVFNTRGERVGEYRVHGSVAFI